MEAYIGLADSHRGFLLPPTDEDLAIIRQAQWKLTELDPNSLYVTLSLADSSQADSDWATAEAEYRKALTLYPTSGEAHSRFSNFLFSRGRRDEARAEETLAIQLGPNPAYREIPNLQKTLMGRGQFARAIERLSRDPEIHQLDFEFHIALYNTYERTGMYREATEELGRIAASAGFPEMEPRLLRAFAASGYKGTMWQYAQDIEHYQALKRVYFPVELADTYAKLGDIDRFFYWLEEGRSQNRWNTGNELDQWRGELYAVQRRSRASSIAADPRFIDLLRRAELGLSIPPPSQDVADVHSGS